MLFQLHFHSRLNTLLQWVGQRLLQNETRNIYVWQQAVNMPFKKIPSYDFRNPHYKPEMVSWPSQVYNGNPYTNNRVFLENRGPEVVRRALTAVWTGDIFMYKNISFLLTILLYQCSGYLRMIMVPMITEIMFYICDVLYIFSLSFHWHIHLYHLIICLMYHIFVTVKSTLISWCIRINLWCGPCVSFPQTPVFFGKNYWADEWVDM